MRAGDLIVRLDSVTRLLLILLFMYCFTLGATWNGVLIPDVSLLTMGLLAALFVLWRILRWRGRWRWYNSPLDPVFVLWGGAFGLAFLANLDSWRKIFIGGWYVGLYVLVWYVLHDLLANKKLKRSVIVEAFLFAGLLNVLFGYLQLAVTDVVAEGLPRVVSLVGNPNAFGLFMVVLLLLIIGQGFAVKTRIGRLAMLLYFLISLPLLLLTFSRGAVLGMISGVVVFGALTLQSQGVTFQAWWSGQNRLRRGVMMGVLGVFTALLLIIGFVLISQTLSDSRRNPLLRGRIYANALTAFSEKPLTGHGLFTFGEELGRLQSQPPRQPHSHAHNIVLHIAAELGVSGLSVLLITIVVILIAIQRHWRQAMHDEKPYLTTMIAVLSAYAVTHQFDMLIMMPLMMLLGLVALVMATTIPEPKPIEAAWRLPGHPIGVTTLGVLLIVSGVWSSQVYANYNTIWQIAILESDYREGADHLQAVVDADPNLALYTQQQGYLYGIAAHEGDTEALQLAIDAYMRYIELQPYDAIHRANLAALQWQAGLEDEAIATMQQAVEVAPAAWQYYFILGNYAEAAGEYGVAIQAYKSLTRNNYNLMYPEWEDTALRREFAWGIKRSRVAAVVLALDEGTVDTPEDAAYLWEQSTLQDERSTRSAVLQLLLFLAGGVGDDALYQALLADAEARVDGVVDEAWLYVAKATLLRDTGNTASAERALEMARALLARDFAQEDYPNATNVAHFQFLRYTTPRQFLPQVYYPTIETLPLLRFLD